MFLFAKKSKFKAKQAYFTFKTLRKIMEEAQILIWNCDMKIII